MSNKNTATAASAPTGHRINITGVLPNKEYQTMAEYMHGHRTKDVSAIAMRSISYFLAAQKIKKNIKYSMFGIFIATGSITLLKALYQFVAPHFGLPSLP